MAIHELRPMSTGEIFDAVFGMYRTAFVVLVSIVIICQGLPSILYTYVLLGGGPFEQPQLFLVSLFFSGIGATVSGGAIVVVVSRTLLGADVAIEPALRAALRAFVPLFAVGLARVLLVLVAALFFLIPGVIVACGYVVAEQVIMLERPDRAVNALPRSWSLTKGFKGKVFRVVLLLLVFLQLLPATAAGVLGAMMPALDTYVQVGSSLVQLVLFPLMPISFTLLYYDLRVRKEAFDLVFMCSQLGIDADDAGVIAA